MNQPVPNIQTRLEQTTVFTLLGIRFWDAVRDAQVRDSLLVTARPVIVASPPGIAASRPAIRAFPTGSGVYAFQGLPGLHDIERPAENGVSTTSPPIQRRFFVEVRDEQNRFIPMVFGVELPLDYRGVFLNGSSFPTGSPPISRPPGFYLFSAPTRRATPGLTAVRACLIEAGTQRPAAHAVLEVEVNGRRWYGISDERGCIAVLFPYPTFINIPGASPPETLQILPFNQQRWTLSVRVRFSPDTLEFPLGEENQFGERNPPDLRSIFNQSPGVIWPTYSQSPPNGTPVEALSFELVYGQELVLRTADLPTTEPWGLPAAELWIDRNTSPP
ncbi:MAG: hypothetical protein O7E52_27300 [Candidatus Poribacteria bacterium]|nr:hypothetical protein [Candidatus Poribacteria bacterium]